MTVTLYILGMFLMSGILYEHDWPHNGWRNAIVYNGICLLWPVCTVLAIVSGSIEYWRSR